MLLNFPKIQNSLMCGCDLFDKIFMASWLMLLSGKRTYPCHVRIALRCLFIAPDINRRCIKAICLEINPQVDSSCCKCLAKCNLARSSYIQFNF